MAANYWTSTQYMHWQFEPAALDQHREESEHNNRQLYQRFALPEPRLLSLFFNQQLQKLAKRLPSVRQQALATAQVYVRRFLTRVEIRDINVFLLLATALYLASKMEECPQHVRTIVHESRGLWPGVLGGIDVAKLGEYEFHLISEMDSQMIIHQPYRPLSELAEMLDLDQSEATTACPFVIAVTAIFLTLTLKPTVEGGENFASADFNLERSAVHGIEGSREDDDSDMLQEPRLRQFVTWLANEEIDLRQIVDCSQEMISLYHVLGSFSESICKDQVHRYIKARGLNK